MTTLSLHKGVKMEMSLRKAFSLYVKTVAFQSWENLCPLPQLPLLPTSVTDSDWLTLRLPFPATGPGEQNPLWGGGDSTLLQGGFLWRGSGKSLPSQPCANRANKLPTEPTPAMLKKKKKPSTQLIIFLEWDLLYNILITTALQLEVLCSWSQGPSWDVVLNEVYNSI